MKAVLVCSALAALMSAPVAGNMITIDIHPSSDPRDTMACALVLARSGQMRLVETAGLAVQPGPAMAWMPTAQEETQMVRALMAFVAGDIPSLPVLDSRTPPPPYVAVTWSARMPDGLLTGYWHGAGLALPPLLEELAAGLLAGGPCAGGSVGITP